MSTIERLGSKAPNIFVRRLVLTLGNAAVVSAGGEGKKKGSKKRPLPEKEKATATEPATTTKVGRQYEYVNCNALVDMVRKTLGPKTPAALKPYIIQILTFCVALCGCDFTHGVPWLNGSGFWKNSDLLWPGVCAATSVDTATGVVSMNPRVIAEKVIGKLWKEVQFKKFCISTNSYEQLYKELMDNGSISAFRRERLISPEKLCCLVKGCNWTVNYWYNCEACPCAVHGEKDYGFVLGKGSRVEFDDKKALPVG